MSAPVWSSSWFTLAEDPETKLIVPAVPSPMCRVPAEMASSSVSVSPRVLTPSAPPRSMCAPMLKVSRNATPVPAFTVAPVAISMLSPFSRAPVAPVTFAPALNCTAKSAASTDPATRSAEVAALISAAAAVPTTVMAPFAVVTKIEPVAEIPFTPPTLRGEDVIDIVEGEEGARHRHVRRQIGDVVVVVQLHQPDIVQAWDYGPVSLPA